MRAIYGAPGDATSEGERLRRRERQTLICLRELTSRSSRIDADHGDIDFLVNNAAGNFIAQADQLSANGWSSVIGIVLNGTFFCSSAIGKRMIAKKSGGSILQRGADLTPVSSYFPFFLWQGTARVSARARS